MSTYCKKTVKQLRVLARTRNIRGRSKMNKQQLCQALRKKTKKAAPRVPRVPNEVLRGILLHAVRYGKFKLPNKLINMCRTSKRMVSQVCTDRFWKAVFMKMLGRRKLKSAVVLRFGGGQARPQKITFQKIRDLEKNWKDAAFQLESVAPAIYIDAGPKAERFMDD